MSKTKNIFNFDIPKIDFEEEEKYVPVSPKKYSEEIMSIKKQQAAFYTTNDMQTYMVVCFSCKEDLKTFKENLKISDNTFVDGYELARKINIEPKKPALKLPISLDEKFRNRQK